MQGPVMTWQYLNGSGWRGLNVVEIIVNSPGVLTNYRSLPHVGFILTILTILSDKQGSFIEAVILLAMNGNCCDSLFLDWL